MITEKRKKILIRVLFVVTFTLIGVLIPLIVQWHNSKNPDRLNRVNDYDGNITFDIPFETSKCSYQGKITYFDTPLSYEEMQQQTADGTSRYLMYEYTSILLEVDGSQVIMITAEHNKGTSYFTISDVPNILDRLEIKAISPEEAALLTEE